MKDGCYYSAQNGSESRFRDKCFLFFSVDLCYILWSVLLHHLICVVPLVEFNCTVGVVLRQCFSILFEFQVIRKGCIFSPFLPFVLLFLRSCCIHSRITSLLYGTIDKQSPNGKLLLFSKRVLLLIVSELSSGLLPLPFKVRITIDKQSPNGKLYDR